MPVRGGLAGAAPAARNAGAAVNGLRQGTAPAAQQLPDRGWNRSEGQPGSNTRPQVGPGSATQNARPSGSPTASRPAAVQATPQNRGGWQRFGDPGARTSQPAATAPERQLAPQQQPADRGWNRFGSPQVNRPQPQAQPQARPRQEYRNQAPPSYNAPRYSAPPAVAPRPSAPSYSAPRYSAPAPSAPRSAPASPSRGGGGGSRGRR